MTRKPAPLTADRSLPRKSIVLVIHPEEAARVEEPKLPEEVFFPAVYVRGYSPLGSAYDTG